MFQDHILLFVDGFVPKESIFKIDKLSPERIDLLESIGFKWTLK